MAGFRHNETAHFYDYWRSLCDDGLPNYRLFDPIQIPKLMPNVLFLKTDDEDNFVYQFAGTDVCAFVGGDLTGRLMKDFFPSPEIYASTENMPHAMLSVPCGQITAYQVRSASGRECIAEFATLPLSGADGTPDRLVVHMAIVETTGFGEGNPEVSRHLKARWVDLGSGVPEYEGSTSLVLNPVF